MSIYTRIARPYAKAAFEYAAEKKEIVAWNEFLEKAGMIVKDRQIQALLRNPKIDTSAKLNLIINLCNCNDNNEQKNLLAILAKHHRLIVIPYLVSLFKELVEQHDNTVDVMITTAFAFSVEQQKKLQEALKIRLGKTIHIKIVEDKKLIGGVIIQAGDLVIDASVQGKLKRLCKLLNEN